MRKMKKINGFLIVRFNDREKRNNPTLGSFGVIDAEQYTGDLDFDLDAFEYTDADLIEIAVEQARGLDAEEDYSDDAPAYTVTMESAEGVSEEEVFPKAMALSWAEQLKTQIKSKHYEYTVNDADGDALTVKEELNDTELRTINNAPRGEKLTISITSAQLYALGLNTVNTLKITVTDGKGGTAYRRLTFKRTNSAPSISGQDTDLGPQTGSFAEEYTVTDVEGDNVVVTEYIDDKQIRSYQATLGQTETIELSRAEWLILTNGAHRLRVEAVDGNFATSVRVWNFSKDEKIIEFQLAAPEETDERASKILITPTWKTEGATVLVEACNNAFDEVPTWEDITAMVFLNRVYNFINTTKTADKWGVNVRFKLVKNEGYDGEVSVSGFGGAFE